MIIVTDSAQQNVIGYFTKMSIVNHLGPDILTVALNNKGLKD